MTALPPTPTVDYSDKDFESMRRALLELAAYRVPEWTDRSAGDLGMLFVDLFAYVADVVSYYQDRLASELYLDTAVDRRSVMHLLRLLDYELTPPAAAAGALSLWFKAPAPGADTVTVVPSGFVVTTRAAGSTPAVPFTYLGDDLSIDLAGSRVTAEADGRLRFDGLPVRQGTRKGPVALGTSRGEAGLRLAIAETPVQLDTVVVEVQEGGGWRPWPRRRNLFVHESDDGRLVPATAASDGHMLEVDEAGTTWVVFGDGEHHRRPPIGAPIRATYLVGGDTVGNVAAGTVTEIVNKAAVPLLDAAANHLHMSGGAPAESIDHAKRFAPLAFRSRDRAVTLRDHITLARQVPGVGKVTAVAQAWNRVDLYLAPAGDVLTPMSAELRGALHRYFEDRRMIGTSVRFHDAHPVPIELSVEVLAEPHADEAIVVQRVERAVRDLYAFAHAQFGQPLYISKVYEAVEAIDGVRATRVTRFGRLADILADPVLDLERRGRLRRSVLSKRPVVRLPTHGQIEVGPFELPVLQQLDVHLGFGR